MKSQCMTRKVKSTLLGKCLRTAVEDAYSAIAVVG